MSVINKKTPTAERRDAPRWRRRKGARPQEIIAAALEVFAERGFAATRLEDIAAKAGVTRGTLYLYFPNKEELFKAMVRQSILPILATAEGLLAASDEPTPELLRKLVMTFPERVIGSSVSAIPKLVIAEARNFPDLARFYLEEVIQRGRRLVRALVQRGIDRGEFREVDMDHILYCVIAPVLVAALWQHSFRAIEPGGMDPQALCRAHVDLLLNGLAKPGAGR
jgi:AcrR family transcriptional regulator